jgi:hypothetical protein
MTSQSALQHQRGQALVETLASLPVIVLGATLVLGGLHSLFAFYLTDYWVYQSSLCLVRERQISHCRQQLQKRLAQLPFSSHTIHQFKSGSSKTHVSLSLDTSLVGTLHFEEKHSFFLKSEDFGAFR